MSFVKIDKVTKSYRHGRDGSYTALQDFSFAMEEAEIFCLVGPTGCGKTTLLNLLAGFEAADRGTIALDGAPIKGSSSERAVVFQGDDSLFAWLTAQENVEFGPKMRGVPRDQRRQLSEKLLQLVGLKNQGKKYPHQLSGGMKQRIQIARVLANDAKMLLMDEPFGALDAQTRRIMQFELLRIWRDTGKTIFFITHDIDEAITLGTRVGVMRSPPSSELKEIIPIALGPDRDRADPRFFEYFKRIEALIGEEVSATVADGHSG